MYPGSAAPRFIPGGSANTAICLIVAGLALVLRFLHIRENKKLERAESEGHSDVPSEDGHVDRRAVGFRHVY